MEAASRGASEPRDRSPQPATSRAEPAVSPATWAFNPSRRMILRHWPRAWTWLWTLRRSPIELPFTPISWKWMGRKYSPTMCSPEFGIKAWMSATRPAIEFSIGIMPRLARPSVMAAKASSNVGHGSGSQSGYWSAQAIWELAPASPW